MLIKNAYFKKRSYYPWKFVYFLLLRGAEYKVDYKVVIIFLLPVNTAFYQQKLCIVTGWNRVKVLAKEIVVDLISVK